MTNLATKTPEQIEHLRTLATLQFTPELLRAALQQLSKLQGGKGLDAFERSMVEVIEAHDGQDQADFASIKEFAIEQLYQLVREAKEAPDIKHLLEDIASRRTPGRSENPETLEEQLQSGLEGSFPASDPPAVVSSTISGGKEKHKE